MSSQNNNQNLNPKFEYYLNRQGMRGRGGQKGDQGESVHVTVGKNTANTYTLIFTSIDGSFETPNLRGSIIDSAGSGTFLRYDKENDRIYLSDVDQATTEEYGLVKIATENQVKGIDGGDGVITAENLGEAMSYRLAEGENIKLQYNEDDDTITISSTGGGGSDLVFNAPLRLSSGIPNKAFNCTPLEGGGVHTENINPSISHPYTNELRIGRLDTAANIEVQLTSNTTLCSPCGMVDYSMYPTASYPMFFGHYNGDKFVPVICVGCYSGKVYTITENEMASKLTINELAAPSTGQKSVGNNVNMCNAVQIVDMGDSYYIIAGLSEAWRSGTDKFDAMYYAWNTGVTINKSDLKGELTTAKIFVYAASTSLDIKNSLRVGSQNKQLTRVDIQAMTRTDFAQEVVQFDTVGATGVVLDIDNTLQIKNGKLGVAGDLADVGDTINQLNAKISSLEARVEALESGIDGGSADGTSSTNQPTLMNLWQFGVEPNAFFVRENPQVNDRVIMHTTVGVSNVDCFFKTIVYVTDVSGSPNSIGMSDGGTPTRVANGNRTVYVYESLRDAQAAHGVEQ